MPDLIHDMYVIRQCIGQCYSDDYVLLDWTSTTSTNGIQGRISPSHTLCAISTIIQEVLYGHYFPNSQCSSAKLTNSGVGSNIATNHSSNLLEVISSILGPCSHAKLTKHRNDVKLESVWTLLRITRLTHRMSYLVIMWPNSHTNLTKSEIRSSWESVRTLLRITQLSLSKSYLVIISPNSHGNLTKVIRSNWSPFQHCSKSLV